jgi:hypothetical protein
MDIATTARMEDFTRPVGGMLVAAYSVKTRPSAIFLIISLLAILIMHTIITNQLAMKSRQDMDTAFFYIEHAEKLLFESPDIPRERPSRVDSLDLRSRWQQLIRHELTALIAQITATAQSQWSSILRLDSIEL